jgi:hypothetical protein
MRKLIYTRVALRSEEEANDTTDPELKRLQNAEETDPDTWGKATLLLDEIVGVIEHYPDNDGPDPETCNITFKNGKTWGVDIPYEEVKQLLREFHGEAEPEKTVDIGIAMKALAQALNTDPELYSGWRRKIFESIVHVYKNHQIIKDPLLSNRDGFANLAAADFLDNFIKSIE